MRLCGENVLIVRDSPSINFKRQSGKHSLFPAVAVGASFVAAAKRIAANADGGRSPIGTCFIFLFYVERQNFTPVDHTWVVRERDDGFARGAWVWLDLLGLAH